MSKHENTLLIGGVIICLLLATYTIFRGVENSAISAEEQIFIAQSDIKVQEKRRLDLIYNLVDTVKEYDKHESETLIKVVEKRAGDESTIQQAQTSIKATAERYPQLKSSDNYRELMNELSITENLIAQHRSNYNLQVKKYNRTTRKFPNRRILSILGYEKIDFKYLDYRAPEDAPQNIFKDRG